MARGEIDDGKMLTMDSPQNYAIVFSGSHPACLENGLVLEAKSLPYELVELDGAWALAVPSAVEDASTEELARYANERIARREEPSALLPFRGAAAGAIGFTAVLLLIAYCAGIGLFGADWFAAGALERNALGGFDGWRAMTALTLHVDQLHLLSNLLFGVGIGAIASSMFGPGVAWAGILTAGALGNYMEMLVAPLNHRAVGASTAVFAALGLLSGFGWRRRLTLRERWLYRSAPLIAGVSLLTLLGVGTAHVDVLGHLLGFLAGVALGWVYARAGLPRSRGAHVQWLAAGAAVAGLLVAWAVALRSYL